ncbi:cell wall integrity and stress response component 4-like isoform X2 [Gouania willdenowi]|uniref:Cell wall integrity and stress response component 4-like n=1 Tax=Gouania willdenowi TaxID=441366 RepID=A0A8C5DER9_GOUWI|nr:cell wall integrity and stress response component 4-like isoform X2 [Gouania willdenowi]
MTMKFTGIILICCCAVIGLSIAGDDGGAPNLETLNLDTLSLESKTTTKTPNITTTTTTTKTPKTTTKTPNTTTTTKTPKTTNTTKTPNTTTTTKTPKTTNTTKTPNTTTTTPKTTTKTPNTTTTTPKTTTKTPNTTTTTPKTTTKTPNTTTTTTTPKTTNTTTTTKSTTTVPPAPTPPTTLRVGTYNVTNVTNNKDHVCVLAQMAVQIRLLGPKNNGTFIVQPNKTTAIGWCHNTMANLTLVFTEGFITFVYNKNVAKNRVYVSSLRFSLTYAFNKGVKQSFTGSNQSTQLFAAGIGHCYSCKDDSLYLGHNLYLDVSQDKMQAFNLTKNRFGYSESCPADTKSYRVAVAVGVTLLILVVVVVVIYIWHRRKNADGYQPL